MGQTVLFGPLQPLVQVRSRSSKHWDGLVVVAVGPGPRPTNLTFVHHFRTQQW